MLAQLDQECPALVSRTAERVRAFATDEQIRIVTETLESAFGIRE